MRTSSTLIRGQKDLGALVAAIDDLMERDVGRTARGQAIVGAVRFGLGLEHVAVDAVAAGGGWDRLAATPSTIAQDPVRLELRRSGRKVGRLEIDGRAARRTQREALQAILPLLARAVSPASHDVVSQLDQLALPPMAIERAGALWSLTRREREVLGAMAIGATNKVIANQLGCTEGTLEHHVRAILRKAGCENRAELIALTWGCLVQS